MWRRMSFKPPKSRSFLLKKENLVGKLCFQNYFKNHRSIFYRLKSQDLDEFLRLIKVLSRRLSVATSLDFQNWKIRIIWSFQDLDILERYQGENIMALDNMRHQIADNGSSWKDHPLYMKMS